MKAGVWFLSTKVTIAESFWLQKQGLSIHLIETMHICV